MLMEITKAGSPTLAMIVAANDAPYQLETNSWQTNVARRRQSVLGGSGPYNDVVETFKVTIFGASEAACLQTYHDLVLRLDDAALFEQGKQAIPVLWNIQLEGTTTVWKAVILGPNGDTPMVGPSPTIIEDLEGFWISGIQVSFRRTGRLFKSTYEAATVNPTGSSGTIMELTFPSSADVDAPLSLRIVGDANFTNANNSTLENGMVVLSDLPAATAIKAFQASQVGAATSFSTAADSGNLPSSSSVLVFAPGAANTDYTSLTVGISAGKKVLVIAEVKPLTANANTLIRVNLRSRYRTYSTPTAVITQPAANTAYPLILGVVAASSDFDAISLTMRGVGGTSQVYVDRILLVNLETTNVTVIAHGSSIPGSVAAPVPGSALAWRLDDYVLERTDYNTSISTNAEDPASATHAAFSSVDGDIAFSVRGSKCTAYWCMPSGTRWRANNGGTLATFTAYARRRLASLIPR